MGLRELGENNKHNYPDEYKKGDDKTSECPSRSMLCRPKIPPVSTIRRREPIILDDDSGEEPKNNFASIDGFVERGDFAGYLSIIFWKPLKQHQSHNPHKYCNGDGNSSNDMVGYGGRCNCSTSGRKLHQG